MADHPPDQGSLAGGVEGGPRSLHVYNGGFWRGPRIARILALAGWRVTTGWPGRSGAVAVWGASPTAWRGAAVARRSGAGLIRVEDAFLRSVLPGRASGPLARRGPVGLLIDPVGIHFDPRAPSLIEGLVTSGAAAAHTGAARMGLARLRAADLSKYNAHLSEAAPPLPPGYVLVIDQTRGDASLMGAQGPAFRAMLAAARAEHPGRPVLIRTHPETAAGLRPGHLGAADLRPGDALSDGPVSPWRLVADAHAVYAVSSQLGYEAMLAGQRPRLFGLPFYAGWDLSDDEAAVARRGPARVEALFAASHLLAPTWYDPCRDRLTDLAGAMAQIEAEARAWRQDHAGHLAYGMRLWKRGAMARVFGQGGRVRFTERPRPGVTLVWASRAGDLAQAAGPAAKGEATAPAAPARAVAPLAPAQAVAPMRPAQAAAPAAPARAAAPIAPAQAAAPLGPAQAAAPRASTRAADPAPARAVAPMAPVQAATPMTPAQPAAPMPLAQTAAPMALAHPGAPATAPVLADEPHDAPARPLLRVEDGFLRSRGLGAALTPALSLVADDLGIYYDPTAPSRLEALIAAPLPPGGAARAEAVMARLRAAGLSKYNLAGRPPAIVRDGRPVILVPGQVEDDASIRLGAGVERTNLALLARVRAENPGALIVWKPHPDVEAGLRAGAVPPAALRGLADVTAAGSDPAGLLAQVDAVWTMTSTLGFEALIRGVAVTTLGAPFYAGWGLTRDLGPTPSRRRARPGLAGLVHAALIAYPRYFDPVSRLPCPVEVALDRLADPAAPGAGPGLRWLAKAQGALASKAWLWR